MLGTSVEALALLTYFKLYHYQSELLVLISRNSHPAFAFLCNNLEAKNTILGEVHISLFVKGHQYICLKIYLMNTYQTGLHHFHHHAFSHPWSTKQGVLYHLDHSRVPCNGKHWKLREERWYIQRHSSNKIIKLHTYIILEDNRPLEAYQEYWTFCTACHDQSTL